jgi:hypothetical protein
MNVILRIHVILRFWYFSQFPGGSGSASSGNIINETWSAADIHVVDSDMRVLSGVMLTTSQAASSSSAEIVRELP